MPQTTSPLRPPPDLARPETARRATVGPEPQLEDAPETPVAIVRFEGTPAAFPQLFGDAFELTASAIEAAGARIAGPPFGRYLEFGERVVVEAGFPFVGAVEPTGRVRIAALPRGRIVTLIHAGSYDRLDEAWGHGRRWIDEHGLTITGAPWEVYLTGPDDPGRRSRGWSGRSARRSSPNHLARSPRTRLSQPALCSVPRPRHGSAHDR